MFESRKLLGKLVVLCVVALPWLLLTAPSFAGEDELSPDMATTGSASSAALTNEESSAAADLQASDDMGGAPASSKLSVHGFLTQAIAVANFVDVPEGVLPDGSFGPLGPSPTERERLIGIPDEWTTNYRFLALQFRYDMSAKDVFVVQLSSRALGDSAIQKAEDEIELDWAFYERRLGDNTSLKVGRIMIPIGIYNELRDVGTVLPFYRPAFNFYLESAHVSETVDGIALAHEFFAASDWSLEATAYGGQYDIVQTVRDRNTGEETADRITAKQAFGYQLWLHTPWDLRIGTGLYSFKQDPLGDIVVPGRRFLWHGSIDASFGRFTIQGEYVDEDLDLLIPFLGPWKVMQTKWYAMVGVRFSEKVQVWGLWDVEESGLATTFHSNATYDDPFGETPREDIGVSLNYFFSPSTVLKAEYHWVDEANNNWFIDGFGPTGPIFRAEPFKMTGGNYTIVAVSVAF